MDYYEDNYETKLYAGTFGFSNQYKLDKTNRDSDGDGFGDGMEVKMMYFHAKDASGNDVMMITGTVVSDPTDPNSTPYKNPIK